ncbi:hypothetical protein Tco_1497061 [Tanacetum coccineum]
MSSGNASSTVIYTSVSFDSNGPSWGIPLVNVGELPVIDPYEESTRSTMYRQMMTFRLRINYADDASPTAESPGYIVDSDSMEDDSIDYPDKPDDDDEDPKEDPSEEHDPENDDEDPEEVPSEEHEPEDEGTKKEEPSEGSDETEPFKEDETAITAPPPRHRRARISVRPQTPMAAFTLALIDAFVAGSHPFPLPPTSPVYYQAPLGHRAAMIHMRDDIPEEDIPPHRRFALTAPPPRCDVAESSAAARAPRGQYDFVDTVEAGQGLIRSPGHDARTITRAADRAEDVGYLRALQAFEHRMMTSIEEVKLRVSYQAQRTAYKTELHEVRQAYLSSEARNRALLAQLETLETHMSRIEWQRQNAEDHAVKQMMRT